MSNQPVTLKKMLSVLKKTYNSIDIRAVVIKGKLDSRWSCIFLKVLFSDKDVKEIETLHRGKEKNLGRVDGVDFKVIFEVWEIGRIGSLLNDIEHMNVRFDTLKDTSIQLLGEDSKNILKKNIQNYNSFLYKDPDYITKFIFTTTNHSKNIINIVEEKEIDYRKYIAGFDLLRDYLEIETIDTHVNVALLLPILKKVILTGKESEKSLLNYIVHKTFLHEGEITVSILRNEGMLVNHHLGLSYPSQDRLIWQHSYDPEQLKAKKSKDPNNSTIVIPFPKKDSTKIEILPTDRMHVRFFHDEIREIFTDIFSYEELLPKISSSIDASLLDVFKIFRAYSNFYEYINSGDDKEQVKAINWLMSLIGFCSIPLSGTDEEIPGKTRHEGSADVISYHPEEKMLIVLDGSTGIKRLMEKVNAIKNTVEVIQEKVNFTVIPIVICNKSVIEHLKTQAALENIIIIDNEIINEMMKSIQSYKIQDAKRIFFAFVRSKLSTQNDEF